jgi:hypothetical protein
MDSPMEMDRVPAKVELAMRVLEGGYHARAGFQDDTLKQRARQVVIDYFGHDPVAARYGEGYQIDDFGRKKRGKLTAGEKLVAAAQLET